MLGSARHNHNGTKGFFMARTFKQAVTFLYPASLQGQMFILVFLVVFGTIFVSGAIFTTFIGNISKAQISKRALDIGHTLSMMPKVHEILQAGVDPHGKLQRLAEQVRKKTNAEFVVIADRQSRRFSHPRPEKIGKHFVGDDERPALIQGKAYVS